MNVSHNDSVQPANTCSHESISIASLLVSNILTVFIGQPAIAKVLWISCMSRKTMDILNFNLAIFHNIQYLLSFCHLIMRLANPNGPLSFTGALVVFAQTGAPMSLSLISLERYVAVLHPTSYNLLKTYRYREVCAVAMWLCSIIITMVIYFTNEKTPKNVVIFWRMIPLVTMMIMIILMVYCSVRISRVLRKSGPGQDKLHPIKRKAFTTVCATAAITLFCYIPVAIIQNITFKFEAAAKCFFTSLMVLFLSIASVVHPLIYLKTQGHLSCKKTKTVKPIQ